MTNKKADEADSVEPDTSGFPVDRGWAWVILAAVWLINFLCVGVYKALGILFVEFQRKYSSSSSVTALVFSLLNAGVSITSLCVMTFGLRYVTTRQCVMMGSLVVCVANIIGAFAKNIDVIILSQGILVGIGQGLMFATSISHLGRHFKKRLGLANGIACSGGSVGSLVFPTILRSCLDEYSLFGTLLLLGAIFLHGAVAGALMRPTESYRRNRCQLNRTHSVSEELEMDERITENNDNGSGVFMKHIPVTKDGRIPEIETSEFPSLQKQSVPDGISVLTSPLAEPLLARNTSQMSPFTARAIMARNRRHDTISGESQRSDRSRTVSFIEAFSESTIARYASNEWFPSALGEIPASPNNQDKDHGGKNGANNECFVKPNFLVKLLSTFDCSVLKRLPLLFFLPCSALLCSSSSMIQTFLPPFGIDQGLTDKHTSLLITVIGGVDLSSIIIWGFIADTGWLGRHHMISLTAILLSIATFCIPLYTTFTHLIVYSVIYGLFGRVYLSLYPVVLVDFLGVDKLRASLGITVINHALSLAVMLPASGYLRDSTGTYILSFRVIASFMVIGGLGILTLPLAERCERRMNKSKGTDNDVC